MNNSINVGLVGYGYAGKTLHAPLIAATPGMRLSSVMSSDAAKVRADFPQMAVAADLAEMLRDPTLDLVVIATPNALHASQAHDALAAGKHVVVDKPSTVTMAEAQSVIGHAEQAGRLLSVFQIRRWDADFRTLQRLMADGSLGPVTEFRSHFDRYRPAPRDRWRERAEPGAGTWFDLAPHLLDQSLALFGMPRKIYADIASQRQGALAPDYFHALLQYADCRVILHSSSLAPATDFRFAAHGTKASVIKQGFDRQEGALKAGRKPGDGDWGKDDGIMTLTPAITDTPHSLPVTMERGDYCGYYAAIRDAIRGSGVNPVPPAQILEVMTLILAGLESASSGREIRLD